MQNNEALSRLLSDQSGNQVGNNSGTLPARNKSDIPTGPYTDRWLEEALKVSKIEVTGSATMQGIKYFYVHCPNEHNHTVDGDGHETKVHIYNGWPCFKCHHAHCVDWNFKDYAAAVNLVDPGTGEIVYKKEDELAITINQAVPVSVKPETDNKLHLTVCGYDDVEIKPIDFMFFPWFPRGYITAVQGDSGSSKSTFMYAVGALVSTGKDLNGVQCEDPGNVMFITSEDDSSDIKTAFQDAGGDLSKLLRIREREETARLTLEPEGVAALDEIIKKNNIRLLVLDPIQQFISGDINKASETRPQMARLMNVASDNNIAIVLIEHMGKDTSKSALHRAIGSVDVNASTRSLLQVVTDPEDDLYKIMFTVKNNLAALHDVQRAIRYQVKDHPNSFDEETQKRQRFRGHAEFVEFISEYNERVYRKAVRKADEAAEEEAYLEYEYNEDPIVVTARELIAQNPNGLFIGADDFIQKITFVCGRCPYDQSKSKVTGIYSRVNKLRNLMIDSDGIQIDVQSNSIYPRAYNWRGALIEPAHFRTKGFMMLPVKASKEGFQQTKI